MQDMLTPWPDVVSGALTMVPYGWSWLEVVYKKRAGPTIDAYGYRSQHNDGLLGVVSRAIVSTNPDLARYLRVDGIEPPDSPPTPGAGIPVTRRVDSPPDSSQA